MSAAPPSPDSERAAHHNKKKSEKERKAEEYALEEVLPTDNAVESQDIHAALRKLRKDEVVGLSQDSHNRHTLDTARNYTGLVALETGRYVRWLWRTWTGLLGTTLFGGLSVFDWFSVFFFAFGGTILLAAILVFCLAAHFPMLVRIYYGWSDKYGGGLGLVNSGNPNLFHALTTSQAEAAKEFLSGHISDCKDNDRQRFFNLDGAKMLLQLASVIYEHENDAIRAAVTIAKDQRPHSLQPVLAVASAEIQTGLTGDATAPGDLVESVLGVEASDQVDDALASPGDAKIRDFCRRFGLDFEPISELNNTASAFTGLFWDPSSNWIVVAFKGTAPLEFGEWLSDFNSKLVNCGDHIDGFKKVHKGFKDRVYPDDVSNLGEIRPYDTIALGIKTLSKWLRKKNGIPDSVNINVWFTGHSLGCATATLVYSRFLMRHKDMGKKSTLRDAYLFAAPIVCDRESVDVFNAKMMADRKRPKTMWRVTSNGDAVATCLPDLGDRRSITVSPNNAFAFAHLGTEIRMKDHPHMSNVAGHHVTYGTRVAISSKFSRDEIAAQRGVHLAQPGEQRRESIGILLQKIPIIGRFVAHGTIYYWDQLDRVAIGQCEWTVI